MLLQTSVHHCNVSLSSSTSYSHKLPPVIQSQAFFRNVNYRRLPLSITCSVSQTHSYGTVDFERRPMVKWNAIYRRISLMENPELGSASVLNQWENEGKKITKWEIFRVIKELRKYRRYERALEIYDWMSNRGETFKLTASDAAIQLDLISKVYGIASAEDYFVRLPKNLKDRRTYGALLNAYVKARQREKAESLLAKMRTKGYAIHTLSFNVMMTLYVNFKEYEKVESLVSEMIEKGIRLDIYSYNIWISSRGLQGSIEKMEEVYERMKQDRTINANWTTFSTMATMYIKTGMIEKAEECLRRVESRIVGRDRIPFHYLMSLYGSVGNKEETYRVWKVYKTIFPTIPNLGYHAIISALIRAGDIEGAEKIYEEWLSVKTAYDPRIANLFMGWYVKEGMSSKAESFFNHMVEAGGKPNSSSWEILADGLSKEGRVSDALASWKEAFSAEGSRTWRPKHFKVLAFFNLCEKEGDIASKEVLVGLLRQSKCLQDKSYVSLIGLSDETIDNDVVSGEGSNIDDESDKTVYETDDSEMLLEM
ncbi:pentatricopeptide repeat-containing protein At1g02150 [Cucurbita moschata]|uniref:Pentatricopeptide repeat-containing protein At1g02150 n=1 Tax=Cucurbita moschata TaxID=3662 RepID=A0A6J1FT28_CUCMO|nr:pentatricopeptide repeat-containing protein At1g02150 [Cucurbita moschata]